MLSTRLRASAARVLSTIRLNLLADHEIGAHKPSLFLIRMIKAAVLLTHSFKFDSDASVDNSTIQFSTDLQI